MAFNVAGARKAGYSDAEIADYLASQSSFKLNDARSAGYSDTEIVDFLSGYEPPKPRQPKLPTLGTGAEFKDEPRGGLSSAEIATATKPFTSAATGQPAPAAQPERGPGRHTTGIPAAPQAVNPPAPPANDPAAAAEGAMRAEAKKIVPLGVKDGQELEWLKINNPDALAQLQAGVGKQAAEGRIKQGAASFDRTAEAMRAKPGEEDSAWEFSVDQAEKLIGKGAQAVGGAMGLKNIERAGREYAEQQEQDIDLGGYKVDPASLRERYNEEGFVGALKLVGTRIAENWAPSGVTLAGSAAAALTAVFSAPAATVLAGATAGGAGLMGVGEVKSELEDKGIEGGDGLAVGAGALIGLLDMVGAGKVIPKDMLTRMTGNEIVTALVEKGYVDAAKAFAKEIGKKAAYEGLTEMAQEGVVMGAAGMKGAEYEPMEVIDRLIDGAVIGAAMGGGVGTVSTGVETARAPKSASALAGRALLQDVEATQFAADGTPMSAGPTEADYRHATKSAFGGALAMDGTPPHGGADREPPERETRADAVRREIEARKSAMRQELGIPEPAQEVPVSKPAETADTLDQDTLLAELGGEEAVAPGAIDEAAHAAATSPKNDLPEPTQAQKEAGNYAKGHVKLHGLDISIENPSGSKRSGVDPDGRSWEVVMRDHYGYIRGTVGKDKDHIDAFIVGPNPERSQTVYVVDQVDPKTGRFDEHKVLIGMGPGEAEFARARYLNNYAPGWKGLGAITEMPVDQFKDWLANGDTTKPVAKEGNAPATQELAPQAGQAQGAQGLSVGTTPNNAEPVTVRNGVVHVGKYPAMHFETGEDVAVPSGADNAAIAQALRDAGALSNRQRVYGLPKAAKPAAQPLTPAGEVKKARAKRAAQSIQTADDLSAQSRKTFLKAIKDMGGIKSADAADVSGEPAHVANRLSPGLFRKEGNAIDLIARRLNELGYLSDADYNDVDGGAQAARDLIGQALAGEAVMTPAEQERYRELVAKEQELAEGMPARNEALASAAEDETTQDAELDLDALPTMSEADAMRALGFTEDEINGQPDTQGGDTQAAEGAAEGRATEGAATGAGEAGQEGFALEGQSPEQLKRTEQIAKEAAAAKARKEAEADAKAQADAERDSFTLTGSNRAADANPGQGDIFGQPDKLSAGGKTIPLEGVVDGGVSNANVASNGINAIPGIPQGDSRINAPSELSLPERESASDERFADGLSGNPETISNSGKRGASAVKGESGVDVPTDSASNTPSLDAASGESGLNVGPVDAKLYANLLKREPALVKGYRSLDVEAKRAVLAGVADAVQDLKVLDSIVRLVPVDVVNNLVGAKFPSKALLDNPAMLADALLAVDPASDVAVRFMRYVEGVSASGVTEVPGSKVADAGSGGSAVVANKSKVTHAVKYGETNTIFTADAAEKARAILRKKLGQLNSGIDPELMQAGIVLAGHHIEAGARSFAAYAKAMIDDLGDVVKPYLKSWYAAVALDPRAAGFDGMDSLANMQTADVDAIAEEKAGDPKKERWEGYEVIDTPSGKKAVVEKRGDGTHEFLATFSATDSRKARKVEYLHGEWSHAGIDKAIARWESEGADDSQAAKPAPESPQFADERWDAASPDERRALIEQAGRADIADIYKSVAWADLSDSLRARVALEMSTPMKPAAPKPVTPQVVPDKTEASPVQATDKPDLTKSGHWHAGKKAFQEGQPRVLPSYFTKPNTENAKDWYRGWDAANAAAPVESAAPAAITEKIVGDKLETNLPEVEHVTGKGKTLTGVVVKTLTKEQAASVDKFTFRKDGGYFIRMKHVVRPGNQGQTSSGAIAGEAKASAPGTRTNGNAERTTADRLEVIANSITQGRATPEGSARDALKAVADALRKPQTAADVVGMLEIASGRLMRNYPVSAEVIDQIAEELGGATLNPEVNNDAEQPRIPEQARPEAGDDQADRGNGRSGEPGGRPLGGGMAEADARAGEGGPAAGSGEGTGRDGTGGAGVRGGESVGRGDREPADVRNRPERPTAGLTDDTQTPSSEGVSLSGEPRADFTIGEDTAEAIEEGGQKTKARNNIAAIRLVKKLAAEDRRATMDEQKALAKYVGWGGIKQIFDEGKTDWAALRDELKNLLTAEEYAAANRSILDAHFTSMDVVSGMWAAARHLGFHGGRVLEPSVGVGNFFGAMPKDLRANSTLYGVELDNITGQIAKHLYPNATVATPAGFQDVEFPSNSFDFATGNPPFGEQSLYDPAHPEFRSFSIHQFFFAKALDKVRPGGILQMVVSRYLLDSRDAAGFAAREYLAKHARLLGAIRLPYNAFLSNANTEVVTDIVFLQKLQDGEMGNPEAWTDMADVDTVHPKTGERFTFPVNRYFADHPEMVVGTHAPTGKMRQANQYNVEPPSEPLALALGKAVAGLPRDVYVSAGKPLAELASADAVVPEGTKVYGYYLDGEAVMQRLPDSVGMRQARAVEFKDAMAPKRAAKMIEIRDTLRSLMRAELSEDASDVQIGALRTTLNEQYDAFRRLYGYINQPANRRAFRDDPDLPLLESLEPKFDPGLGAAAAKKRGEPARKPSAEKADIFTKRVLQPVREVKSVESAKDALVVSMNERGRVDPEHMADIYGKPWDDIRRELGDLVFQDPSGAWETADAYLSGNVKAKLKEARAAAAQDKTFAANVSALEAVQPADVPALKIAVRLGSPWVPGSDMDRFVTELFGARGPAVRFIPQAAKWSVQIAGGDETARLATWGTRRVPAEDVLAHVLNNKPIVVKDNRGTSKDPVWVTNEPETEAARAKAQDMAAKFREWIWQDQERRNRLERIYNDNYNTDVRRKYDGSHLTLPGSSPAIQLRPHQKAAIWRAIQDRSILLDHVVGAGKAQPLDAKVLTPSGWRLMGELAVGDMVIAGDGTATTVEAVFPQGEKEIYRVEFSDGTRTECCDEHLWHTQTYQERGYAQRAAKAGKEWACAAGKVRDLAEIRATLKSPHLGAKNHSIPMVSPVQFDARPLPLAPYLLGVLLGDGGFSHDGVAITSADEEIIDRCRAVLPDGMKLGRVKTGDRCPTWTLTNVVRTRNNPDTAKQALETLGLRGLSSHEKFIPDCYLFNSVESRVALLRGLMDTDGGVQRHSCYFYTSSPRLADGVTALVQSLGGIVLRSIKHPKYKHNGEERNGKPCHVLTVKMPADINPFALERKASAVKPKTSYAPVRYIVAAQPVGKKPAQCIRVAHPSHLYVTDDFIVTHNTFEMAAIAMEWRRLGISRKPVFVVPNSLVRQWRDEFYKLYPNANVLAATEADFAKANRKRFMAKIATGDWDAVIVAHSSFKKIGTPVEAEKAILSEQLNEIADAIEQMKRERGDRNIMRDMERTKEKIAERLKALSGKAGKKDDTVTFDELGTDSLLLDEAHNFKNLFYTSGMRNVAGLGNPTGSGRAFDLFVKLRFLSQRYADKAGVVFATGTPVSNSLVEMFTMQRYMAWNTLKDRGLHLLDAWAGVYGDVQNVYEVHPSGTGYRLSTRFAKFVNLPSLMNLYRQFADVVTMDDLKSQAKAAGGVFPVPKIKGGRPQNVVADRSDEQIRFFGVPEFVRSPETGDIVFELPGFPQDYSVETDENGKFYIAGQNKKHSANGKTYETWDEASEDMTRLVRTPKTQWNQGSILWKFENLKTLNKESKGKINALSITNEARKAGLDFRLIDPTAPDFKGSKINLAVDNALRIHKAWAADRGAQLIFCDLSVPQSARAAAASKERDAFVRREDGSLEKVKATVASLDDVERAFLVVKRGTGDAARFMVYDGPTGADLEIAEATRAGAVKALAQAFETDVGMADKLERFGPIEDAEIADWQDANEKETSEEDADGESEGAITVAELAGLGGGAKFSVYDDIKAKLIAGGVPESEVAFIHDYDTAAKKNELFKKVNDGDIRILLGSTEKMGAGMNVQKRLVALHHLDAPWRPSDLEQREGRIVRQGNELYKRDPDGFEVEILRYGTKQTYDTRMWQIIEHKAAGVEQLRKAGDDLLEIDDVGGEAANAADMKAAASGNPLILEEIKLRNEVKSLDAQQFGHIQARAQMQDRIAFYKRAPERMRTELAEITPFREAADANPAKPFAYKSPAGKTFDDVKNVTTPISEAFVLAAKGRAGDVVPAGEYRGLAIEFYRVAGGIAVNLAKGDETLWVASYEMEDKFSPAGLFTRIDNALSKMAEREQDARAKADRETAEIQKLEAEVDKPFAKEGELKAARQKHRETVSKLAKAGGGVELSPEMKEELKLALVQRMIEGRNKAESPNVAYVAQPGTPGYSDPYESPETRPNTRPGQLEAGRAALADVERRILGGKRAGVLEGASLLGSAVSRDFRAAGGVSLVGQTARTAHDLAVAAQVLRDPRFETFRVFFTDKSGKIVGERAYSSRLPGTVYYPNDLSATIKRDMASLKADGYWLLHNHPSGSAKESDADIKGTNNIALRAPGLLGHVIIDHNEYNHIRMVGAGVSMPGVAVGEVIKAPELAAINLSANHEAPHPLLGETLLSPMDLARMGKQLQKKDGYAVLIGTDPDGNVQMLTEVPTNLLKNGKSSRVAELRVLAAVKRAVRETGSYRLFAVVPDSLADYRVAVESGLFIDVVDVDSRSAIKLGLTDGKDKKISVSRVEQRGGKSFVSQLAEEYRAKADTWVGYPSREQYQAKIDRDAKQASDLSEAYRNTPDLTARYGIRTAQEIQQAGDKADRASLQDSTSVESPSTPYGAPPGTPAATKQTPPPGGVSASVPAETRARKAQRIVQDQFNRFTVIQEWLRDNGVKLEGRHDVYRAEERMHGKIAAQIEDFREKRLQPLIVSIHKAGFDMKQVGEYLVANHAAERNAQIAKINPDAVDELGNPNGSGMTDAEAQAVLDRFAKLADFGKFEALAEEFRAITEDTKQILLDGGVISREMADAWGAAYQHYVPLRGGPEEPGMGDATGKGVSVNARAERRRAMGHQARDEWVIENIIHAHERAIYLTEKNRVGQYLVALAAAVPDSRLWTIDKPVKRKVLRPGQSTYVVEHKGIAIGSFDSRNEADLFVTAMVTSGNKTPSDFSVMRTAGDPQVAYMASGSLAENEVQVYVKGQMVRIQLNDPLLARAYKKMGQTHLTGILELGRQVNTFLSKAYTGYNPEFIVSNVQRDLISGSINITGEHGAQVAAKAWKYWLPSLRAMLRYSMTGKSDKWIDAYRQDGGNTGGAYLGDLERIGKDVQTAYEEAVGVRQLFAENKAGKATKVALRKSFKLMMGWIQHMNAAAENGIRVALYRAMIEEGKGRAAAAAAAKNSTVNFNRRGEIGAQLGALYLFANPAIQGSASMGHALFKGKHKEQAWALMGSLAGLAYLLALGYGDDDEWDEIPQGEKDRNMLIRVGDHVVKVAVPYGHGIAFALGNAIYDLQRGKDVTEYAYHMASSILGNIAPLNPLGDKPDLRYAVTEMAPFEPFRIFARAGNNVSGFQRQIRPESKFDEGQPDFLKAYRNTHGTVYDQLTRGLSAATGGTATQAGAIDISPETIKFLFETATGGTGRFFMDSVNVARLAAQGVAPELVETPIARKFVRDANRASDSRRRFWETVNKAETVLDDYRRAEKGVDVAAVGKFQGMQVAGLSRVVERYKDVSAQARDAVAYIKAMDGKTQAEKRAMIFEIEKAERDLYRKMVADIESRLGGK